MKLLLVATLVVLSLGAAAAGGFRKEYLQKIIEVALEEEKLRSDGNIEEPVPEPTTRASLNCQVTSGGTPTSVHALRPQNIEIIGAIGDSLTAANGAKANSVLFLIDEYRGVSWSIGCESTLDKSVTFATILKYFRPDLVGCSTGTSKQNSTAAAHNFAHPGDTSFDMLPQAKMLVSRLNTLNDMNNKWKMINLFIGGNDLCDSCKDSRQTSENFKKNLEETLDYFRDNLKRTFVNLVLTLDVSGIEELTGITCRNMQNSFCDCGLSTSYRTTLKSLVKAYQKDIHDVVSSGKYDDSDLFTVVVHHFMTEMTPPKTSSGKPDYSYFAPDCFHFSVKGHEAAATELWNSLVTPHHNKAKAWTIGSAIKCPSVSEPYLHTNRNQKTLKSLLIKN